MRGVIRMAEENESLRNVFDKYMGMKLDEMQKVSSTATAHRVLRMLQSTAAPREAADEVQDAACLHGQCQLDCEPGAPRSFAAGA